MDQQINRLNSSLICYQMLQHPSLKAIQLQTVKTLAGQYGFNYSHYEKTGVWLTDKEIEKDKKEDPINRIFERKNNSTPCKGCSIDFEKRKENQKFCNTICKNRFHNSQKN